MIFVSQAEIPFPIVGRIFFCSSYFIIPTAGCIAFFSIGNFLSSISFFPTLCYSCSDGFSVLILLLIGIEAKSWTGSSIIINPSLDDFV